jgi:hypothetical protein
VKSKTNILLFAILFPGFAIGQNNLGSEQGDTYDPLDIENIQSTVDSIRLEKNLEILSIDSVSCSSKFSKDTVIYNVDFHMRGNEIVRISLSPCGIQILPAHYSIGGSEINYFLDTNELIFVEEKYIDRSRMGSCGTLSIENRLYYRKDILLKSSIKESPFACYNSPIETDWLVENFEITYDLGIKRIKK